MLYSALAHCHRMILKAVDKVMVQLHAAVILPCLNQRNPFLILCLKEQLLTNSILNCIQLSITRRLIPEVIKNMAAFVILNHLGVFAQLQRCELCLYLIGPVIVGYVLIADKAALRGLLGILAIFCHHGLKAFA